MEELKLCPFCGGEATVGAFADDWFDTAYYVRCTKCGAQTSVLGHTSKEAAKEAWNRRNDNG